MAFARSVLALLLGTSACDLSGQQEVQLSLPAVTATAGDVTDGLPLAPTACAWANSTDDILWGTLVGVRMVETPALRIWMDEVDPTQQHWKLVQCENVNPAMELEIEVDRSARGLVGGRTSIRIGQRQVETFRPLPYADTDGQVEWLAVGDEPGRPLEVGMSIGMAIHRVDEFELWSLMGELMFALEEESVVFQTVHNWHREPAPANLAGLSVDGLFATVGECLQQSSLSSDETDSRRARVRTVWGPLGSYPDGYMAPTCLGP
jgi:hypothetical protein